MVQILDRRTLDNGALLCLERADSSGEHVITYFEGVCGMTTDPSASQYIPEDQLRQLYAAIATEEQFNMVNGFLRNEVNDASDADKIPGVLELLTEPQGQQH